MMTDAQDDHSQVTLTRDCMAAMVPSGARILLHEGTEVTIVQSLGNSMTVNIYGNLARIEKKEADALGLVVEDQYEPMPEGLALIDQVWHKLKQVFDPEIPVNIVDLGLIYKVSIDDAQPNIALVTVTMTLTAPGCGMGPVIIEDVKQSIFSLNTVTDVEVDLVFDPPWDKSMMSDIAQLELGVL